MSYLIHCILRNRREEFPEAAQDGVRLVASGNLAAAVTAFAEGTAAPESSRLLAYESVISALHTSCAVIPLRYGCLMDREARIGEMLEERRVEYESLLDRLEDRAEVGLRVLWEARTDAQPPAQPGMPGTTWLAGARQRHSTASGLTGSEREWAGGLCAGLPDLYSEVRMEAQAAPSGPDGKEGRVESRVVSLYFLVPRPVLGRFRRKLGQIVSTQGRQFLVSGPWPPYNFVSPAV